MLQAILFDLDGTLLPMDYDRFARGYFHLLYEAAAPFGYEKESFLKAMMLGIGAMTKNDGKKTNADAFWDSFGAATGKDARHLIPHFEVFYETEFHKCKAFVGENPRAKEAVALARRKAEKVILATNPMFPPVGVRSRLSWLGLSPEDFDQVTDYETCHFCKPNPAYFTEILENEGLSPEHCLMIGNNVQEDTEAAAAAGIPGFLVTDCLMNEKDVLPDCPQGSFSDLINFLK